LLARRTGAGLGGALCSGAVAAAAAYLAPDLDLLGRWETWAVALVLWAAWEARPGRTASATAGGTPRPSP
nr:hypothetical protein [Acidimicrobiia bacterium]